jgi:hypothetical protein
LRDSCKATKDSIVALDDQLRRLKVSGSEHVAQQVEQQSKQFRAGYDARLQKFLAVRSAEVKEATLRELQPIFQKLQLDHEKEVSAIELKAQTDEAALRTAFQNNLQEIIELDERHAKEESRALTQRREAATEAQVQDMEYEHKQRKAQLLEDLEDGLARDTAAVHAKVERDRCAQAKELNGTQEAVKARLKEFYAAHEAALAEMKDENRNQLRKLEQNFESRKQQLEARLRADAMVEAGAKQAAAAPGSPQRSPHRSKRSKERAAAAAAADALAIFRAALVQDRDRKVQQEIRQLHIDTVRLEREWREQHEADRRQLVQHKEVEESNCAATTKHLNARITELVVDKEELLREVAALRQDTHSAERELLELRKEVATFENGISIQTVRIREKRSLSSYKIREEDGATERQVKELRRQVEANEQRRATRLKEHEAQLSEIQYVHNVELEALEKGVKNTVAVKDKEAQTLLEDVQMEESRMESLQEVLRRYSGGPGANTAAGDGPVRSGSGLNQSQTRGGGGKPGGGSTTGWNNDTSTGATTRKRSGGSGSVASTAVGSRGAVSAGTSSGGRAGRKEATPLQPRASAAPVPVSRVLSAKEEGDSDSSDVSSLGSRTFATTISGNATSAARGQAAAGRYSAVDQLNYEDVDDNNSQFVAEINDLYG